MRQLLAAVEYCHKRKIAHRYMSTSEPSRDLKPENIVFERKSIDSTLKVIDFGRSKYLQAKRYFTEKAGSVCGLARVELLHRAGDSAEQGVQ